MKVAPTHALYLSLLAKATVLNLPNEIANFLSKLKTTNVENVALAIVNKDNNNSLAKEYLEWAKDIYKIN